MIKSISVAGANILTGATIAIGLAVGDAAPRIEDVARNLPVEVSTMDYIQYYSDAIGTIIAGISGLGVVSFYIAKIVIMFKDKPYSGPFNRRKGDDK